MKKPRHNDDGAVIVPVELDQESLRRLVQLGKDAGLHPVELAASLLHDVLLDDERAHANTRPPNASLH